MDQAAYRWSKSFLLIRAYPNEEPGVYQQDILTLRLTTAHQFGLWMQVDKAAPIPVPVQTRIPLLNIADACPTPAIAH